MPIQLAFQDETLRRVCESTVSAKRRYGELVASSLHARLADLRAADSPADLVALGFASIDSFDRERIHIFLNDDYRIYAKANHNPQPSKQGQLDWTKVTRIKILLIERDNDN